MRRIIVSLALVALMSACSDNDSLENVGRDAGAAADQAIERVGNELDDERADIENGADKVREQARDVKDDVKSGLNKVDNAVDAAADELKK